jgi:hypothetical protein
MTGTIFDCSKTDVRVHGAGERERFWQGYMGEHLKTVLWCGRREGPTILR